MSAKEPETPAPGAAEEQGAAVDELTVKEVKIMKPTCPACGADPLVLKRLRYDFPDGVVVEVMFCHNPECRIAIGAQIVNVMRQPAPR